ncbi:hypothetical protein Tco_0323964 [Tanacetum coccineum]
MVKGEEDEESYASMFADSMLNDDVDDSGTKIEPGSHKENPEVVNDVNVIEKKGNDKNDEDVEKMDDVKNNDATCSMETRNEQMQTPIPTPTRSPRKDLSLDKTISKKLTTLILPGSIAGMYRQRGQIRHHIKTKFVTHEFFMGNIQQFLDHCNNVVHEMTFGKTNEMIKEEMPGLVNLVVNMDLEIDLINVPELISKEFATHGPKMIEELF